MLHDRKAHFSQLKNAFPQASIVKDTPSSMLIDVRDEVRLDPWNSYSISLLVELPGSFPQTPPRVIMPYCFHEVPITTLRGGDPEKPKWDPETSSLVQSLRNAFENMMAYWGPVKPPTIASVTEQLSQETDRLLEDLNGNSNCLDAYCYQFPIMKQIRKVSIQTVNEVESLANENCKLHSEVNLLLNEVTTQQKKLSLEMMKLQEADQNKLIISICTPEALIQTLEADLRKLHEQSREIGKVALNAYGSDKKVFEEAFEKYKATSKKIHEIDLKLRAYRASKD
ncbi:unnamed protein product [Phytomonas sp. EM1]|nr:unnamed protein product [Phytomonas sp. EM1]|eukprot:CCW62412.1 unnamed protein product [Phytomonas sp. isolate EM1]